MAAACSDPDVERAKAQATRMFKEAEALTAKHPQCLVQVESARVAIDEASKATGSPLERRNAFVRATFQAGQARACAIVAHTAPKIGVAKRSSKDSRKKDDKPQKRRRRKLKAEAEGRG